MSSTNITLLTDNGEQHIKLIEKSLKDDKQHITGSGPYIPMLSSYSERSAIVCDYFKLNLFNKLTNIINTKITDESLESFMKKQKVPPIRDKKTN